MGAVAALLPCGGGDALAATAQISKLTDVTFTALDPTVSTSSAQSICVYSSTGPKTYSVTATGSGAGNAFTLTAGAGLNLAYGVQWSSSSGASTGTALSTGSPLSGQVSGAVAPACVFGIGSSASVIVTLAASDLQGALSGLTYTGVLTLVITPQ